MKKIIEVLRNAKEEFMTGFNIQYTKQTGHNIQVVHNNNFVRNNGFVYAVHVEYTDGTRCIYIDDNYMALPKYVKSFIYWHELGHINNTNNVRNLECECKADKYAAKKIGKYKAILALNYMWKDLIKIDITAAIDIPSRLKELGVNVDSMYIIQKDGTMLRESDLRHIIENTNK